MLIAGSVLQGFAATAQLTFPYVIQELVPNKHRGHAQAAMIVGVLPFAGFGPVIARTLIENTALGWRYVGKRTIDTGNTDVSIAGCTG